MEMKYAKLFFFMTSERDSAEDYNSSLIKFQKKGYRNQQFTSFPVEEKNNNNALNY